MKRGKMDGNDLKNKTIMRLYTTSLNLKSIQQSSSTKKIRTPSHHGYLEMARKD